MRLEGFRPQQAIEASATRTDLLHRRWRSWARFTADASGRVDLRTQAPGSGTYKGASPMGLFWSMELLPDQEPKEPWRSVMDGVPVHIEARAVNGNERAQIEVQRNFAAPDVTLENVREGGVVGSLFTPPGPGPHPAMIVLAGSSGGINAPLAALLASHGYAALALGYFRMDGLPSYLANIPLEYFETAIAWLRDRPNVRGDFLGVAGASRGGELSLLLGATFPEISAVVAYVPSGVIHGGHARSESGEWLKTAAWTHKGTTLAYLDQDNTSSDWQCVDWGQPPVALTPIFESCLKDRAAVRRSMIPVERINGPVLMISGTDDQMWPSTRMSELAVSRLKRKRHPFPYPHLRYEGAGHLIYQPFGPTTVRNSVHPVDGTDFAFGGSAEADAEAAVDSWPKILEFLSEAASGR